MIEQAYRRLIIPGFETLLKRRKTFRYWDQLEQSQWWSPQRLEALQFERLRNLVDYCFANSPYYRDLWRSHGLRLQDLQSIGDFRRWPITPRAAMRDYVDVIRSTPARPRSISKSTGGSSGMPLFFEVDLRANEHRMAAAYRGYSWAGGHPGSKQTHLWSICLGDKTKLWRCKDSIYSRFLYRRDMLNAFKLSEDTIPSFLRRINRFRPDVIVAYTNPLFSFARTVERSGLSIHSPNSIIVGAEKLYPFQRELIERVFSAPVFETYGCREFTLLGAECERHAGLHLTAENLLVEVVDDEGRPTPSGDEGNLVVTDLFNRAMPFVRYVNGDRAIAGFEQCDCGRGLPLLRKIVGRQVDILMTPDGRRLPGEFFPHLMKEYEHVRKFQVVQSERDLIEVKIVVDHGWGPDARDSLRRKIATSVGSSTRLQIHEVDEIPLTAMGKLRVVVGHSSLV